jgi:hypothetical protein
MLRRTVMTFAYDDLSPKEREAFGFARTRDIAFNAVRSLWKRRQREGMAQKELADRMGRDPAWVSRQLQGPANWTWRTFGAFVVGLNGEADIQVHALEDKPNVLANHSGAYDGYGSAKAFAGNDGNTGTQFTGNPPKTLGLASL